MPIPVDAQMAAMGVMEFGGPEVLTYMTVPRPVPLPTELLVRVHAASVNPLDFRTRSGFATPAAAALGTAPHILGWDVSGTVVEVGDGGHLFSPGDEVYGLLWLPRPGGAYAEYVTAPSRQFARKPSTIDHNHAAAIPLAGLTAWQALTEIACVEPGQRVLVHAGGGGVGHLAVQIAKVLGAHVIATASAGKSAWLRGLGADQVIDYRAVAFEDATQDIDVALDLVGGASPDVALRTVKVLRRGGHLISVAPLVHPDLADRAASAGVRHTRGLLVEPDGHGLADLGWLVDSGRLQVHLDRVFDLADASAAHEYAERGSTMGKVVLKVAE